jgi:hypothetical protein
MQKSSGGNALLALAQQVIAAKLNIAVGADGSAILDTIIAADTRIGNTNLLANTRVRSSKEISDLIEALTSFNEGSPCEDTSPQSRLNSAPITKTCTQARKDCTDTLTAANKSLTKGKQMCLTNVGCKGSARSCKGANKSCNDKFKTDKKIAQTSAKECRANAKAKIGCV